LSPEKGEGDQHGPEISKKPRFHRQMENGVLYFGARESHAPPIQSTGWSQPENRKCHAGPSTGKIVKMAKSFQSL